MRLVSSLYPAHISRIIGRLSEHFQTTTGTGGMHSWACRHCVHKVPLQILLFISLSICGSRVKCQAAELLVADRLTNSVYRYSESGELLGTLIDGHVDNNLNQPVGLAISPDRTKLFVSN